METVPLHFEDRHFWYDQVQRHGNHAIYTQTHKGSGTIRYETAIIRVQPARTWPNGDTTSEQEVYPSSGTWGKFGWTFYTLADAQAHLTSLAERSTTHA